MMPSVKKYYYGADLMKSLHATGGAGGLLMVEIDGVKGYVYTNANGNVEAIYSASATAELLAEYEYSAFGETRKQAGALAEKNPLRYNTRYSESNTGLYYYGYREYSPRLMKWLSKEPLGEAEDPNLYRFCNNNTTKYFDVLGKKATISVSLSGVNVNVSVDGGKTFLDIPVPEYERMVIECSNINISMLSYFYSWDLFYSYSDHSLSYSEDAWRKYVSKSGGVIVLSTKEMKYLYDHMTPCPDYDNGYTTKVLAEYGIWASECGKGNTAGTNTIKPTYMANRGWHYAIGGFTAKLTRSCQNCKIETTEFSFDDEYDYNKKISNTKQDGFAAAQGRHIGKYQNFCGWKPFYHTGFLNNRKMLNP